MVDYGICKNGEYSIAVDTINSNTILPSLFNAKSTVTYVSFTGNLSFSQLTLG